MTAAASRYPELYEQYLKVPANRRAEIIRGTLYVLPRPAPPQVNAVSALGAELNSSFQRARGGPGGWWVLDGPEIHLAPFEPVAPDLAGWRVTRMPTLPETSFFDIVPDWICEVLSPSTMAIDRSEKLPLYAEVGVRHVWLVDPLAKTLEVHKLGDDHRWREVRLHRGDEVVRAEPFDAIELELNALWSPPKVT